MSYKPRTLFRLIEDINSNLFLPHIQRPFVWEDEQMLRLFDSLMRNYPIQTFLFWRTKDEIKARKFMEQVEWDTDLSNFYEPNMSKAGVEKVFVLDGQQRLQTLYAIFHGATLSENNVRQEAYFNIKSGDVIADTGLLYELKFVNDTLPLPWYRVADLLGKHAQRNAEELADELNEALNDREREKPVKDHETSDGQRAREKRVRRNMSQLVSLLREERHFWVQELDGVANEFPYKSVLDIFVRVNSGGTKLDASDLMFAAMKEGWDEIEESIEETTELLNGTNLQFDKTFPLKCLLVAHGRGAEASAEKFTGEDGEKLLREMEDGWPRAESAFQQLRDFMVNDLKVYADKVIRSYISLIPLFDFLYHNPKPNETSRAFMRGYHYKAQLFGWYSQSTDTIVNALHSIAGKSLPTGFPIREVLDYFERRGNQIELKKTHLTETRLRFILLNLVYVDQMGASPFDVKYKGNEPHIDHIYPRHASITKLGVASSEVNHLGNYRFVGATDNIRKRGELPSSYFSRLKTAGIDISKHLLIDDVSANPANLFFDVDNYRSFRDRRLDKIWHIAAAIVNPENIDNR
ncbi:MAG TPA: GmrSD restriction endonuclease domain-containing protein [Candidatus Wunengus sp. YC60]|uniref:GmrSD restriction endonuclease domain-containing protein n=1 Tax=Candidatus Wunengus sp. YC60 TaxID=3367697 RepID=UPI004025A70C